MSEIISPQHVHVFGLKNISICTKEENLKFFNKDYSFNSINDYKDFRFIEDNYSDNFLETILSNINNNKELYIKIVKVVGLTLYFASNMQNKTSYALGNFLADTTSALGDDIFKWVSTGAMKGILIITTLRLFSEYSRGGSKYKIFEIVKQCIIILLVLFVLPTLPALANLLVKKYLPY